MPYRLDTDGSIHSHGGKLVGAYCDGNVRYAPGMAGSHKRKVEDWLQEMNVNALMAEEPPPVLDALDCRHEDAPPFDKTLGVLTPGLREYFEAHNLDQEARIKLIRQLEKR